MILPISFKHDNEWFSLRLQNAGQFLHLDYFSREGLILPYEKLIDLIRKSDPDDDASEAWARIPVEETQDGIYKIVLPTAITDDADEMNLLFEFGEDTFIATYVTHDGSEVMIDEAMVLLTIGARVGNGEIISAN